ncbi:Transducin/WD40 repeat-like superfamily protein [Euphorbia peplus]|nr:Transducin/WD40 repeat-like superfamily protein [Euphorbia peplus]
MSAPSSRTLTDRTAAVHKPVKTLTAFPNSSPNPTLKKSVSGRDNNPRLQQSRAHKPTIRPVPRVDKAAANAVPGSDGRLRWSTSSAVPRGRSSSPSELIRVFRDVKGKGDSDARGVSSVGRKSGDRGKENGGLVKKNGFCERGDVKSVERKKNLSGFRGLSDSYSRGVSSSSSSIKSYGGDSVGDSNLGSKISKFDHIKGSNGSSGSTKAKIFEKLKEKGVIKEGSGSKSGVKYPSKLHEKLAFLEGKVKRIASDIKKTKEMLDMNNPDASKVILTDIQDKISGIELAIGNVGGDPSKVVENGCGENEVVEETKIEKVDQARSLVKGLNSEELEERLFPHHKLLKNRLVANQASESSQSCNELNVHELTGESTGKKLLIPAEEHPIALEFLAALNKEDEKVTLRDVNMGFDSNEVKETESGVASGKHDMSNILVAKNEELVLTTDETLDEFDDPENSHTIMIDEETEDTCVYQLKDIGTKNATGGWFVSEGESVVLAHDDGSCSFYDIANCEEKAVYNPPVEVSHNIWRDCWIIRAHGADGCSGRYVVAASAGNTLDSGFCSWDFYTKDVRAFHMEDGEMNPSRTVLGPLPSNTSYRRNVMCSALSPENRQWWYRPCGPLIISSASSQRVVKMFDIRDGEQVMSWEVQKSVHMMDNSSPLQWRNRGKVVIAESEAISVWDVNSINQQSLLSISSSGRKISALHVINTDAELGGGVRQRVTSAEAEGNDGVFCTPDAINVLDFRNPSGIGLKIPKIGSIAHSVFTRGDSIYTGCTNTRSTSKKQPCSEVQHFSLRKQRMVGTYSMPESNAHSHYSALTQVWGNSEFVMGVSGLGLFVFDALNNDDMQSFTADYSCNQNIKEVIGQDDLYSPTFDYLASRVLLISRDRPAVWRHLL